MIMFFQNKKNAVLLMGVFVLSLIICASNSFSYSMKWWKNPTIVNELNLNKKQVTNIENIFVEAMKEKVDLEAEIKKINLELEALLEKENVRNQDVVSNIDKLSQAQAKMIKHELLTRINIMRELSVEQRKIIKNYFHKRISDMNSSYMEKYSKNKKI